MIELQKSISISERFHCRATKRYPEKNIALKKNNMSPRQVLLSTTSLRSIRAKQQDKTYNGKPIKPVLYIGTWVGEGRYMAAQTEDGKIIKDPKGKPIPYSAF